MVGRRDRCIEPGVISPDELLAYARGEKGPAVEEHLRHCPSCRQRAGEYAGVEGVLLSRLFRRSCPPSSAVGEFAMGMLPAAEMQSIAEHLLECPRCAAERREFSTFLAEPDEPPPSAHPVARVLRRLFAQPVATPAPALVLRGEMDQMTASYAIDGYELTIGVQQQSRGRDRMIVGLLQAGFDPAAGIFVRLFTGQRLVQTATVDDLGNFLIDRVPAGDYRLELTLPASVVIVEPLHVA